MDAEGEKSLVFEIYFVIAACVVCASGAIGIWVGHAHGSRLVQQQAVDTGHAEWVANKDGSTKFQWKEVKR